MKDRTSDSDPKWNEICPEWICLQGKRDGRCWQWVCNCDRIRPSCYYRGNRLQREKPIYCSIFSEFHWKPLANFRKVLTERWCWWSIIYQGFVLLKLFCICYILFKASINSKVLVNSEKIKDIRIYSPNCSIMCNKIFSIWSLC